jgi:FdhD protein
MTALPDPSRRVGRLAWRAGVATAGQRALPEETPIALTYDGSTQAVMMGTPADVEDFAIGFSLTEGIVRHAREISSLEVLVGDLGIEARMWLAEEPTQRLRQRRRTQIGPTGCGLCGIESLAEAVVPVEPVAASLMPTPAEIAEAMAALPAGQRLHFETRAVHGAAFWTRGEGIVALREDVGRHNALDKLAGALARVERSGAGGLVLLTSRVSVEMVQKTARIGAAVIVAISAPTALAVRLAESANIALIGISRGSDFEVFTHPEHIQHAARTDRRRVPGGAAIGRAGVALGP